MRTSTNRLLASALTLFLFLPPVLTADSTVVIGQPAAAPAGYTGDLLTETYNTASGAGPGGLGYDTTHTETGTPNENYTGVTLVKAGEALLLDATAATQTALHTVFANRDEVYGAVLLYVTAYPVATDREIIRFMVDGAQSGSFEIRIDGDGDLTFQVGAGIIQPTDNVPVATWVAVYFHILRDTDGGGASASGSIEWSTSFAKVGSGTKFDSTAVGSGNTQIDAANLNAQFSGSTGAVVVFDDYFLSTTDIPSNPWGL